MDRFPTVRRSATRNGHRRLSNERLPKDTNFELSTRPEHTLARHIQSREFICKELSKSISGGPASSSRITVRTLARSVLDWEPT
jgi:hypothetical protein